MIDRKKGPEITTEFDLSLRGVEHYTLSNGLEVYEVNSGTQNIVKVEMVFPTGRIHETRVASASAAMSLLREGSTRHTAQELAYSYDFYGAVVKASCGMEVASVSLVVLERYFHKVWPIWLHMLFYPAYTDEEVEKYAMVTSQKLANQLAKNDVLSYRHLTEHIFGAEHPYGYNTRPEDIKSLDRNSILDFYNKNLGIENAFLLIGGRFSDETRKIITDALGSIDRKNHHPTPTFERPQHTAERIVIPTENEIQTSIKTGKLLFGRDHEDYQGMRFLSIVLGGYFGSRLMKNIREEKGYTYGIYSSVHGWKEDGFFYISADVDNAFTEPTISEIKKELDELSTSRVPEHELAMVRNYVLGQTLHLLDGPFAKIQLVKKIRSKNQGLDEFDKNIHEIKHIDAERLRNLARNYLDPNSLTTVLAGHSPE